MASKHFISLETAKRLTKKYREHKEKILVEDFKEKKVFPICETFDRAAFDKVLAKRGCKGLRIYFGMDEGNLVRAVIVGVNEKDEDMLPSGISQGKGGDDPVGEDIIEDGMRCPEMCPAASPLNS